MNQSKIDEIVAMIDGFMSEDGGHLNVSAVSGISVWQLISLRLSNST